MSSVAKTNLTTMKQIGKMLMPKLNKAPKHRKAMLRNMCCSLIKFERVETTYAKGKALSLKMKQILDFIYDPNLNETQKKVEIINLVRSEGAYHKLMNNLRLKLQAYRGQEVIFRYSRTRINGNHGMYIVELAKNPKKRKEEKRDTYFSEITSNSYLDYNLGLKKERLYDLLNQHLLLTSLLKENYKNIEAQIKNKNKISYNSLLKIIENNYIQVETNLQIPEIRLLLINQVEKNRDKIANIKSGREYLLFYQYHMSILNHEINQLKLTVKKLEEIKENDTNKFSYNLKYYKLYYPAEYKEYKKVFKKIDMELQEQKAPIRKTLSEIKEKEGEKRKYLIKYTKVNSEFADELDYFNPSVKKSIKEFDDTKTSNYISGDESGFSDLDEISHKPLDYVNLRNEINDYRLKGTLGRKINRNYNRYV